MYNKVETNMNFVDREKSRQTEKFWEDHDIFKKSMEQRKQGETYISMTVLRLQMENHISDTY